MIAACQRPGLQCRGFAKAQTDGPAPTSLTEQVWGGAWEHAFLSRSLGDADAAGLGDQPWEPLLFPIRLSRTELHFMQSLKTSVLCPFFKPLIN